jgi:hypothetical protein
MHFFSRVLRSAGTRGAAVICLAAFLLVATVAVPAFGGPRAMSATNALKVAKKALKKANEADQRSREALAKAEKVGAKSVPGPAGAQGAQGAQGPSGSPGSDAFGTLTYVNGNGGSVSTAGYVSDVALCPSGQAPTGGSSLVVGAEPAPPGQSFDSGDSFNDANNDGVYDSWAAFAYNATGSATIVARVVCAHANAVK